MTSSWITTIKRTAATVFTAAAVLVSGCSSPETSDMTSLNSYKYEQELNIIDDNYRNYYQIFVGSFCDSNGDGIGDLNGITSKLDYIQDMGFNGIWLTPIMPSRSYHKYSVEDYYSIDPQFGTMEDFENLSAECEKRGISLLIDLVMNHSSRYHSWFESASQSLRQEPCGAPAEEDCLSETLCPVHNKYVGYYYFEDEKPAGSAAWYQTGTKWYQAVFSENMPELQLDNPDVREEFEQIAKFWLDKGIGGFRLDAVKEYFTGNPDKNVEVLNWFCDYCHSINPDCYIVGEVWESFTTYTKYYASSIDSVFGFTMAESDGTIAKTVNLVRAGYGYGRADYRGVQRTRYRRAVHRQPRHRPRRRNTALRPGEDKGSRRAAADDERLAVRVLRRRDRAFRQRAGREQARSDDMGRQRFRADLRTSGYGAAGKPFRERGKAAFRPGFNTELLQARTAYPQ